jgi:hypothetical protein
MTPTPTPIPWFTPTPFPTVNATAPVIIGNVGVPVAEAIVQGYQTLNSYNVLDIIIWAALVLLIIGGVWATVRRVKEL